MLSVSGRCFTFDASANGYARGEGAGVAVLQRQNQDAPALLRGIAVNQDGRSSTLTAPNGPSQQTVMLTALQEGGLSALEVGHMECHGTGTPLGDPIEVGALQAINRGREHPLVLAAVKSEVGHLEGAAASTGLIKSVLLLRSLVVLPTLHLRQLNVHLADLTGMPSAFATEQFSMQQKLCTGGLSSFGFGGTNAHAVMAKHDTSSWQPRSSRVAYNRRAFPWREVGFRFLRSRPDESTFEVEVRADVYDVVKHHVVFGSIVVPGVVYAEMALQATRELLGHEARLTDVSMVFPFVIPLQESASETGPVMRFVMRGQTRFEIQSTSLTGKVTVHAEGGIDQSPSSIFSSDAPQPQDLQALRERIDEPMDPADVYGAIDGVGLWLGPMFQVAKELYRKETSSSNEVFGRLELAPGVPNIGYVVHPALFDGTIHTLGTASVGKNVNDLKIFGGVGRVTMIRRENFSRLSKYWIHLNIKEKLEASETFDLTVLADDGSVLMLMDDVVFRKVLPEQIQAAIAAQSVVEDDQKFYELAWTEDESPDSEVPSPTEERLLLITGGAASSNGFDTEFSDVTVIKAATDLPDLSAFTDVVSLSPLSSEPSLEVLDEALRVMQAAIKAKDEAPRLWFVTQCSQNALAGDMKASSIPWSSAKGDWGLPWCRFCSKQPR
jgi:acyl transferase domain-containing protein